MKSEAVFLEILGVLAVLGASYGVTQVISITPFDREMSRAQNNAFFCAIPMGVYLAYRAYFGLSFLITSKIPQQFKYLEWYLSTLLVSGGLAGGYYVPTVRPTLLNLLNYYAGDLQAVLYTASKPELEKAYTFGWKIAALIGAWFAVLFVVELAIRLVVLALVAVLRAVGLLSKAAKEVEGSGESSVEGTADAHSAHEKSE